MAGIPDRQALRHGVMAGVALTPPALAVLYAGHALARLPFPPFDLFDRITRILPGGVVTFGIDAIVALIELVARGRTAELAKPVEQLLATGLGLLAGVAYAVMLAAILARLPERRCGAAAILGGLAVAALALMAVGRGTVQHVAWTALWLAVAAVGWSWAVAAVFLRLSRGTAGAAAGGGTVAGSVTVELLDRRRFLVRLGGASAAITVVGAGLGLSGRMRPVAGPVGPTWSDTHPLPNAGDVVTPVPGTRPELTPLADHYRIDIKTSVPRLRDADWRLEVMGLVGRFLRLPLAELSRRYAPLHQFVTLACISNRIGGSLTSTTRWTGVPLRDVLRDAAIHDAATHLVVRAADGFHETVARDLFERDQRVMLTYAWDGLPLLPRHGFPLRIYVPDRYGMKQPKWITSLEAVDRWQPGYWVRRGWDREARMHATAVIDTVVAVEARAGPGGAARAVAVGGIAHAGARGISAVELRVDDGPWQAAQLRTPLATTTWVIWRYEWEFHAGPHTFAVRCRDGAGTPQIADAAPVRPAGATGLHRYTTRL